MKAAETFARRGHQVILIEREPSLGGQVNLILKTPMRETFAYLVEDLARQLGLLGVDVRLNTEADYGLVKQLSPDGVVVATGAGPSRTGASVFAPMVSQLPGADRDNVATVWDVLLESRSLGARVVVLDDDGTRYSAGVAEVLLDRGHDVEVVTPWTSLFPATAATMEQGILYSRLFKKGLRFRLNAWARSFSGNDLQLFDIYTGAGSSLAGVDALVLATARVTDDELYFSLKDRYANVHRIGDCVAPRKLDHAIYEGHLAGRELWSANDRYILEGSLERWEGDMPEKTPVT
jgi:hypothetical protein